jgi:hypothetical protein
VLLCQAAAWVHAATPHVTCAEHGESVHLASANHAAARPVPTEASPTVVAAAEVDAHGHDHCGLQGQRTTSAGSPSPASSAATFAPALALIAPETKPPLQLLRLAPKTSPPRAPVV